MGMENPVPQFRYVVQELKNRHPDLAYIHMVEPARSDVVESESAALPAKSNDFAREIWKKDGGVFISAGEFDPERALEHSDKTGDVIAFGRWFISNVSISPYFNSLVIKLIAQLIPSLISQSASRRNCR
jgi:NADPH2 dehydrogenase